MICRQKIEEKKEGCKIILFPKMGTGAKNNKKKGKKSEVFSYEIDDIKRIREYFIENEMWIHLLFFTLSCNMARRVGDMCSLSWEQIFDPSTGKIRKNVLEIQEQKTDKLACPRINQACKEVINLYLDKTGIDPKENNYQNPVFLQPTGTYKGRVLTDDAHRKALKKAGKCLGIEYNIGTHSARKTFGKINRMLHANDYDSMEILQMIYNHSDVKTTRRYIGLTREKIDKYYDDFGDFFKDYIEEGKKYNLSSQKTTISIDVNDLRDIITMAYTEGKRNAKNEQTETHLDILNSLFSIVDELIK